MVKHTHPLLQLHGRWYRLRLEMKNQKVSAGQCSSLIRKSCAAAFKFLREVQPDAKIFPEDDLRTSLYHFLFAAPGSVALPNPDQMHQERFALIDFMLARHEAVVQIIINIAPGDLSGKDRWHSQRWDLSERTLKLLEAGKAQLCSDPNYLKFQLRRSAKEDPDRAAGPRSEADACRGHLVAAGPFVETQRSSRLNQLGMPVVDGNDVYVAGRTGKRQLRAAPPAHLAKGQKQPNARKSNLAARAQEGTDARLRRDHRDVPGQGSFFVATNSDGIYAFDRAGGCRQAYFQRPPRPRNRGHDLS